MTVYAALRKPFDKPAASGHREAGTGTTSRGSSLSSRRKFVLVSPNISEHMGGEAIKAYQFLRHLVNGGHDVTVITHSRSADVLGSDFPDVPVFIIEDSPSQVLAWNIAVLRQFVDVFFFRRVRPILRRIIAEHPDTVVHYLCPVSPILPRFPLPEAINVLGPLTGNIYYPPAFRYEEPLKLKLRRTFHYIAQRTAGVAFGDKKHFHRILVSGGERTRRSLAWAGVADARMLDVVDSGVSEAIGQIPLINHVGDNFKFMTSARLVTYKGVHLSIEAMKHVRQPITFDIYGDGPIRDSLEKFADRCGVSDRIRFLGWTDNHALINAMPRYRGYVAPSLAEANGIGVQEAMMAGLPVICLRWGGPVMLADTNSAIFIEPDSREQVVRAIAAAMDALAVDPERANSLVRHARAIAERRFGWNEVTEQWQNAYELAH